VPVLCAGGTEDRLAQIDGVRKVAAVYRADLREYDGRGHFLIAEPGWEAVATDVLEWLAQRGLAVPRDRLYTPV
jgi:alpha-beta hydrolase superfamily lysophospholipase